MTSKRYGRGWEAARQHILEAEGLSRELGGTDKDVKEYFFNLPKEKLSEIFDEYGDRFGSKPKSYAVDAFPLWKSGRRQMSGLVAGRLFSLLPGHMPPADRFSLVERLWKQHGPRSKTRVEIGPDATPTEIEDQIEQHLTKIVVDYRIPEDLQRRFAWITEDDSGARQDLLNQFQSKERQIILEGLRVKIPVFLESIRAESASLVQKLDQVVSIGNHEIRLSFEATHTGIEITDEPIYFEHTWRKDLSGARRDQDSELASTVLFWLFVLGLLVWLMW